MSTASAGGGTSRKLMPRTRSITSCGLAVAVAVAAVAPAVVGRPGGGGVSRGQTWPGCFASPPGGAPALQGHQYASQLAANPRDYAAYFNFTRPGQPIPVPAFAAQLASGQSLGRPSGVPFRVGAVQGGGGIQGGWQETPGPVTPGGGIQGGWQETPGPVTPGGGIQGGWQETPGQVAASFGLAPGQFTPRNLRMMTPSERATSESLISAQGEDPADFYARAQQFFPFGRVNPSARYTSY